MLCVRLSGPDATSTFFLIVTTSAFAERKLTGSPSRLRTFSTFTVTGPIPV
jgi:hypothetical protein